MEVEAEFAPDVILASSAFETIRSIGLDLLKSDTLRGKIINLFEMIYPFLIQETKRLEDQLWPAVVIPVYQKHFMTSDGKSIPVDYEALLLDTEFLNMLSYRGTLWKSSTRQKGIASQQTQEVILLIENELRKRR